MAVFGILILLVIYLLINAKVSDIEFLEEIEEMRQEKAELDGTVEEQTVKQAELFSHMVEAVNQRENIELRQQLDANEAQISYLDDAIVRLNAQLEAQTEELSQILSERFEEHPGVVRTRDEVIKKRSEIDALKKLIREVQSDAEEEQSLIKVTDIYLEELEDQFRVEIDKTLDGGSVYLVDLDGHDIRTFLVRDGEQEEVASTSPAGLIKAIESNSEKKRVFIFVRPGGIVMFNAMLKEFRSRQIPVGYQPVPDGHRLILTKYPDALPEVSVSTGSDEGGNLSPRGSGSSAVDESQGINGPAAPDVLSGVEVGGSGGEPEASPDPSSAEKNQESSTADESDKASVEEASEDASRFLLHIIFALLFIVCVIWLIRRVTR